MDVDDVELAYGRGGLERGCFSSLDAPPPVDEAEEGEGGEGALHGHAPSKPSMTQQEQVGRRLGQSNGKVRAAAEVVTLVQQLSMMLAVRLQRLSTNFLNEAGSVLQTIMDPASKQFAIELLLPWVQRVALLESGMARRVPRHVEGLGFRMATCDECLTEVFAYALEVSGDGLPPLLAKFWRHLANAVPARVVGQTPHNVMVLARWVKLQEQRLPSERDKRICSALLWFIKGLALAAEVEATDASRAAAKARWQSAGGVARKASTHAHAHARARARAHARARVTCTCTCYMPCAKAPCQCPVPTPPCHRSLPGEAHRGPSRQLEKVARQQAAAQRARGGLLGRGGCGGRGPSRCAGRAVRIDRGAPIDDRRGRRSREAGCRRYYRARL